jgi:hypothetical protein
VLGTHVAECGLYLLPLLRTKGSRFRVGVVSARFWQERHLVAAILPLPASRLFAADAKASVDGDPVKPGSEGAVPPEVSYVPPDPDPDLLACILGVFDP